MYSYQKQRYLPKTRSKEPPQKRYVNKCYFLIIEQIQEPWIIWKAKKRQSDADKISWHYFVKCR